MPKTSKRRKNEYRITPLRVVILLVKIFLISIGNIPVFLMGLLVDGIYNLYKSIRKIHRPHWPHFGFLKIKLSRPRVGRPSKTPRIIRRIGTIPWKIKLAGGIFLIIVSVSTYTIFTVKTLSFLPSPTRLSDSESPLTSEFYDRSGKLLYRLYEGRNRTLIQLKDLPTQFVQATISIEDKNFYKHKGLDFLAILRAFRNNIKTGDMQGASTITQQLIKNTLLSPEKTYTRKIKEVLLAFWTERMYTKDEILQMYFNEVPYGGTAWGAEAASQMYFGKSASKLDLAESAFLAGLTVSPTKFSPYSDQGDLSKERQKEVLSRMVEEGYITPKQAEAAYAEDLTIRPPTSELLAPHFVMYVKRSLTEKYGAKVVSQGGLKIYTTLNLDLQEELQRIVKEEVDKLAPLLVSNGAAMVTDAKTGQILAMIGSKDYYEPNFGAFNVTDSPRQPGSSIKPITYATAFKQGLTPATIILDVPVRFPDGYAPVNYDGRFHGPVTVRTSLGSSYNIPAVKALATVGVENMIETAKDMGITTFDDSSRYGLSLTLGGGEVKMVDMMSVYDTFSQMGTYTPATAILKVTDSHGNVLEEFKKPEKEVLQPEIAYLITNILADNGARTPAFGPNSLLYIPGYQVAVKTGTTDIKRDNWTFGYNPEFVVGVWVGNNDNRPMHPTLTSGVTGAAPIWNRIMQGLLKGKAQVAFERPTGVIDVVAGGRKDLAISGILPRNIVRVVKQDDKVLFTDPFSNFATSSASLIGTTN